MAKKQKNKFVPRPISASSAAQGYNNEGRGDLIGYIAEPDKHEEACRYRISAAATSDSKKQNICNCRIGLWQEKPKPKPRIRVKAKSVLVGTLGVKS